MRVELRDSLENLFPDSKVARIPCRAMALDVARGATAAVHLLVEGLAKGAELRAGARDARGPVRAARWFRLLDVPVEQNTGLPSFTEAIHPGKINPHVIRRAPFRTYDAMEPAAGALRAKSATVALRLELPVPPEARPGPRQVALEVSSGRQVQILKLTVRVCRAVVPPVGAGSFPYTNWFSYENIAGRHGLRPWSEPHWRMLRRYVELMARARQNTFWVPFQTVFARRGGALVLDRARLRRMVATFTGAGLHFIEGGHLAGRTGGVWKSPTFDAVMGGPMATSGAGNAQLAAMAGQLREEIDARGWRARWLQHVADEPIAENAAEYRILVGMVRKYLPGIPILDATMDPGLAGSVDIWCPQVHEYQKHRAGFEAQRRLGDRVWYYTCCSPGGPWLNRLLDQELLRPALLGWAGALFGLDGFLHWGLNHYRADQDPFAKSVVPHGGNHFLPAGDTHVVYPGADGPWSSLRLEAQREGFEDLELLRVLGRRDPRAAARIVRRAVRSFDCYTRDVRVFRAARRALLKA